MKGREGHHALAASHPSNNAEGLGKGLFPMHDLTIEATAPQVDADVRADVFIEMAVELAALKSIAQRLDWLEADITDRDARDILELKVAIDSAMARYQDIFRLVLVARVDADWANDGNARQVCQRIASLGKREVLA